MFKVNNKDTRTTPCFTPCYSVSIVNFEQVIAGWVKGLDQMELGKRFHNLLALLTYFSPVFHIEIIHFICSANQITGFYMKCSTGLKQV